MPLFFQSHCGAIATWLDIKVNIGVISFNPTVVRLRLPQPTVSDSDIFTFNPTVVRLRPLIEDDETRKEKDFQSHCGAIATLFAEWEKLREESFNPTVVRLRLSVAELYKRIREAFNPTVVRLRHDARVPLVIATHLSIPLWCDCDARLLRRM